MNLTSPNDVISDVISFKRTQIHIIFLSGKLTTYQCVAAALFMWKKYNMIRCLDVLSKSRLLHLFFSSVDENFVRLKESYDKGGLAQRGLIVRMGLIALQHSDTKLM